MSFGHYRGRTSKQTARGLSGWFLIEHGDVVLSLILFITLIVSCLHWESRT